MTAQLSCRSWGKFCDLRRGWRCGARPVPLRLLGGAGPGAARGFRGRRDGRVAGRRGELSFADPSSLRITLLPHCLLGARRASHSAAQLGGRRRFPGGGRARPRMAPNPAPGPLGGAAGAGSLLPWGWRPPFGVRARNKCCGSGGAAPRGPTQMVNLSDGARLLGSPLLLPDAARLKPRRSESNDPGDLCGRSNLQLYFETNLFFFFCKGKPVCEIEKRKNPQTNFLSLLSLSLFLF